MVLRVLLLILLAAAPAFAQRLDVLTGEPARPPGPPGRRDPIIVNAPHAPRQAPHEAGETPIEIYVAPQVGAPNDGARYSPRPLERRRRPP